MIKVIYRKARKKKKKTSSEMKVLLLVIYIFASVILGYISKYIPQFIKVRNFLFVFVIGKKIDPTTIITTCCLPPLIG